MALDCELYSIGGNAGGICMALGRCIAALYYRQHYLYLSARIKKRFLRPVPCFQFIPHELQTS
jgi:hypothetical protein